MKFDSHITCSLKQLYDCNGVDGFNDLIVENLGHNIADATWKAVGVDVEGSVLIRVWGDVFEAEPDVQAFNRLPREQQIALAKQEIAAQAAPYEPARNAMVTPRH